MYTGVCMNIWGDLTGRTRVQSTLSGHVCLHTQPIGCFLQSKTACHLALLSLKGDKGNVFVKFCVWLCMCTKWIMASPGYLCRYRLTYFLINVCACVCVNEEYNRFPFLPFSDLHLKVSIMRDERLKAETSLCVYLLYAHSYHKTVASCKPPPELKKSPNKWCITAWCF